MTSQTNTVRRYYMYNSPLMEMQFYGGWGHVHAYSMCASSEMRPRRNQWSAVHFNVSTRMVAVKVTCVNSVVTPYSHVIRFVVLAVFQFICINDIVFNSYWMGLRHTTLVWINKYLSFFFNGESSLHHSRKSLVHWSMFVVLHPLQSSS